MARGLERVAERREARDRAGECRDGRKIKTIAWRKAHLSAIRGRGRFAGCCCSQRNCAGIPIPVNFPKGRVLCGGDQVMSIVARLTAEYFKRDQSGRTIVYPFGPWGLGYFVPDVITE